ncbi:bis(5'-nucleosyl)-tetraphosphatase (symmetrical) YqeK [Clostridium sp.]|uniref:bis(5'-nucleosyl)-tetraphosphatase (symmetrical) YqeK n=1 Tax=Clostridium sp. TaxID=1506 RepID=UPI003D6D16B7
MWSEVKMYNYLHENLKEARFRHSLSVSETAVALAIKYGVNIKSARIAGLVHDCSKNMKDEQLIKMATNHGLQLDEVQFRTPTLLHGIVGGIIAREVMGIYNDDIINAISFHTTGRKNMSILEKIIFISDYTEPLRKFDGVEELRCLSMRDLDAAVLQSLDNTIKYIVNQKKILHNDTVDARNYLLCKNSR